MAGPGRRTAELGAAATGLTLRRRLTVAVAKRTTRNGILMPSHHDATRRVCPSSAGAIDFTHTISGRALFLVFSAAPVNVAPQC